MSPQRAATLLLGLLLTLPLACRSVTSSSDQRGGLRTVRPPVAFELLRDNPNLPILDLRPAETFPRGHVRGAMNVPLADLANHAAELARLKERTFLIYCDNADCALTALRWFLDAGFEEVVLMEGGAAAWERSGFRLVEGQGASRVPEDASSGVGIQ